MKASKTMKKADLMPANGMSPRAAGAPMKGMTMDQMSMAKKSSKGTGKSKGKGYLC